MSSEAFSSYPIIDPKEVVDRAEIIVYGSYDFSHSDPEEGYHFDVKDVIRGNISKPFIPGIHYTDVPNAKEFQESGGEYLIFVEYFDDHGFYFPVEAINGMVKILDGEVVSDESERKEFFEKFIRENQIDIHNKNGDLLMLVGSISVLILLGLVLLIKKRKVRLR